MHSELVSPTLNTMLRADATINTVAALIGPNVSLYHSKLLMKAAKDGTAIPWHQDYAYWKRDDNRPLMVNCMLAIDPTDEANGCTEFVAGSHHCNNLRRDRLHRGFMRMFSHGDPPS